MEVAEPPSVILVVLSVHARPRGYTDWERPSVPANPFKLVAVSVEIPVLPAATATSVGVALREKSWTRKVTRVLWEIPVLETVALTV